MISKIYSNWMEETQCQKMEQILNETKPYGRILDVGCGPGFLERYLDAFACDTDLNMLRRFAGTRVLCSGDELPFKSKTFDFVFCIDAVHLLKSISELERVSKRFLVISIFCNEYNFKEKMSWLCSLTKLKICKKFFVKGKYEWDAVLLLKV